MALDTHDIPLGSEGMNTQAKPWTIPDGQCRYLQDGVLDQEGLIKRRGPVRPGKTPEDANFSEFDGAAIGIVATEDPQDVYRLAVLHGGDVGTDAKLGILTTDYTTHLDNSWDQNQGLSFASNKRHNYCQSPHPWGGTIIGVQNATNAYSQTSLGHWAGSTKADNDVGNITVSQNSRTVTGENTEWLDNAAPGMFLRSRAEEHLGAGSSRTFFGIVQSVESDTSLTLVEGSLFSATNRQYQLRAIRPLSRRVAKGTITTTKQTKIVQGSNTKFRRQGLRNPATNSAWVLFRADDMEYIGKVASVQTDIQLTLTANAEITCNKDKFVAIDVYDGRDLKISSAQEQGWITARWAGRQWYANRPFSNKAQPYSFSRVWFSDIIDPEALDLTGDGDHILIPSTNPPLKRITGMVALPSCLVVAKEDETYGIFGTDETNFTVRKIADDGAFGPMSFQTWNDGVIWAGQKGIWYFDGSEVFNIIEDRIKDWYELAVQQFPTRTYAAYSMLHKNNYVLYIDKALPSFGPDKTANDGNTDGIPPKYLALCIQLDRRAVSTFTNFSFLGAVRTPFEETLGTLYLVNTVDPDQPDPGPDPTHPSVGGVLHLGARICQAKDLFEVQGLDTVFTDVVDPASNDLGPDFYFESKRYDLQNPQIKKRWKQLMLNYRLDSVSGDYIEHGYTGDGVADYDNNYLAFATLVGLNSIATISLGKWRITRVRDNNKVWKSGFQNKRLKFNKRSQHIGFRIWQSNLTGIQNLQIGPAAIGWKWMRMGRV